MKLKVGDKVELLDSICGYFRGDIGTIVQIVNTSCGHVVDVKGRRSTSLLAPYVAFSRTSLKRVSSSMMTTIIDRYNRKVYEISIQLEL